VIKGGRVIDPETNLDAVREVGISGNEIAAISETPLQGRRSIDAVGLIVSPGFIDLHSHSFDLRRAFEPALNNRLDRGITRRNGGEKADGPTRI